MPILPRRRHERHSANKILLSILFCVDGPFCATKCQSSSQHRHLLFAGIRWVIHVIIHTIVLPTAHLIWQTYHDQNHFAVNTPQHSPASHQMVSMPPVSSSRSTLGLVTNTEIRLIALWVDQLAAKLQLDFDDTADAHQYSQVGLLDILVFTGWSREYSSLQTRSSLLYTCKTCWSIKWRWTPCPNSVILAR